MNISNEDTNTAELKCPKCGFPHWKSLIMIHEEGTISSDSSSSGGGIGGGIGGVIGYGGIGFGGARGSSTWSSTSSGQSMSKLAERAAPPDNEIGYLILGLIFIWIVICLILYWWLGPIWKILFYITIGFIAYGIDKVKKEYKDYVLKLEVYNTHAACLRCGEFFKMRNEINGSKS